MLKLFSKPTNAESDYCTIGMPIIDVIVAELLLEPMMEEEEMISTMKPKSYLSSNSIMQTLNAHTTLFKFQMLYSFSWLWNIFPSMCPDSVKDKRNPRDWKHWLHQCWKGLSNLFGICVQQVLMHSISCWLIMCGLFQLLLMVGIKAINLMLMFIFALLGLSSIQSTSHCPTNSWVSHWIKHVQLDRKVLGCIVLWLER